MDNPIGIIDSGVGGLSIWKEVVSRLPQESTIYIADQKYCPYGVRSQEEVYKLAKRLATFLLEQHVKLIVLACNTITVSALDVLRKNFDIPLIGTVPVIKTAAEKTKNKKIGVLSTVRTSHSEYQKLLIEKFARGIEVLNIGTDKLVPFVEKGVLYSKELHAVLEEELEVFRVAGIDTLALGCTHFPFLKEEIQSVLPHVLILDSGAAVARQTERVLTTNNVRSNEFSKHRLYTTANKGGFEHVASELIHSFPQTSEFGSLPYL